MPWIMSKRGYSSIRSVSRLECLWSTVARLVPKAMYKSLYLSRQSPTHPRRTLKPTPRYLIALLKCSQRRLFIVLNGQKIYLGTCLLWIHRATTNSCLMTMRRIFMMLKSKKLQKMSSKWTKKPLRHSETVFWKQERSFRASLPTKSCSSSMFIL